jgi:hypothetical protein
MAGASLTLGPGGFFDGKIVALPDAVADYLAASRYGLPEK